MRIIVHPQKGNYRIFFLDQHSIRGAAFTEISETPKGDPPGPYGSDGGGAGSSTGTPRQRISSNFPQEGGHVFLTKHDASFERFLDDFQVSFAMANLCRVCLLEEKITPLNAKTAIRYGVPNRSAPIVLPTGTSPRAGAYGTDGAPVHVPYGSLLSKYRDVDRVLASIQPEQIRMSQTLFDRLEAHPVQKTARIALFPVFCARFVGVETLLPAQQMAVDAGLLYGKDLLVVSATASGKTFIGEMAGIKNLVEGRGQFLFLVPLVALAVQKYQRFNERYGAFADVGIMIGMSRIYLPDNRPAGDRNTGAPVIVGTYEGVDHLIRCGTRLRQIGTVVIDEVQMLEDSERGHRLDGLIARLKYLAPKAQFLYLSATIGMPKILAKKLGATLVRYDDRPVSLERYLLFLEHKQKIPTEKKLV